MKLLDATGTPQIEQSNLWKERILSWMAFIGCERIPLQSVLWLQRERGTECLQFSMADGVQPVPQRHRPLTSMENLQLAGQMGKAEDGQIRCMSSKVSETPSTIQHHG